ncbi:MAG: YbaB/EbfC family nucleoid-associated protein [Firmicutes bacterium]|nr:YbaB/EbfC family nucleoid-associated protein [Bacillota bacterium]
MPKGFGGGFGGMDMNKMMKQVQKVQEEMLKAQEELGNKTVEGSAGGGAVRAVVSGKQELKSIEIKPEAVDPEDLELLQDLIVAAVNDALKKSQELASAEMSRFTGGLKVPGLF